MGKLTHLADKPATEQTIVNLLEVRFEESDPEVPARAELLTKKFSALDGQTASVLYPRLANKNNKERITALFYSRISPALNERLLKILKTKVDQYRTVVEWQAATMARGKLGDPAASAFPLTATALMTDKYSERLRDKIRESFTYDNAATKRTANAFLDNPQQLRKRPNLESHGFNEVSHRLLYLRYYYEGLIAKDGIAFNKEQAVEWILKEEMAYQKDSGVDYTQAFPDHDFTARFGTLNTQAKSQRDFRCATSHHPRPDPAPEPIVREPSAREMFLMLLKEVRLTEGQFNSLSEQMQKEKFTDDEIADMFANAYIYPMYEQALTEGKVVTLREFIKIRKREAEAIKQYNAQHQRFVTVDPREIRSSIFTASGNEFVKVIAKVLKTIAPVISIVIDFIPVIGQVKGLLEAAVGFDVITGRPLADWERALAILPGGIEHSGKLVKGLKVATRAAAKTAKSPELLVVLTLAVKSGKHPVDIIENMKAVATMSEQVVSAAAKEIKSVRHADKVAVTSVQRAALDEVAKALDYAKKVKPSVSTVSAAQLASVAKPVTIAGKHVQDLPVNGKPDAAQRMVDAKRSAPARTPSSRDTAPDALPVSDKKQRRKERRKKKGKTAPGKPKIPAAEQTPSYQSLVSKGWTKQELGKSVWTPWGKYQTKHSGVPYEYVAPFSGRTRKIDQLEIDKHLPDKLNLVDYKHHKEVEEIGNILKKSNDKFDDKFFKELEKSGHYRGFADKVEQFLDQVELIRKNGNELNKIIIRCSDSRTQFIYMLVKDNLYGNIYKAVKGGKFVEVPELKQIVDAIEIVVVK